MGTWEETIRFIAELVPAQVEGCLGRKFREWTEEILNDGTFTGRKFYCEQMKRRGFPCTERYVNPANDDHCQMMDAFVRNMTNAAEQEQQDASTGSPPSSEETCAVCGKNNGNLKLCTGCRLVRYCDKVCQLSHRKAHKRECKREAKRLAAAAKESNG